MGSINNQSIEDVVGVKYPVLDDGYVILVDYMGTDTCIANAARTSYGEGTRKVNEDHALIRYLMRHDHTTPFEMCELKFKIRCPMDVWRQWIRQRTASVNEYSTRYSIAIDHAHRTEPNQWRAQSTKNKQGSGDFLDPEIGSVLSADEGFVQSAARRAYEDAIKAGVSREQARKNLTLSTYTEAYWKIDVHNLMRFLGQRMNPHAQYEIRMYANTIFNIFQTGFPATAQAFLDYNLNSYKLSAAEVAIIKTIMGLSGLDIDEFVQKQVTEGKITKREQEEFIKAFRNR